MLHHCLKCKKLSCQAKNSVCYRCIRPRKGKVPCSACGKPCFKGLCRLCTQYEKNRGGKKIDSGTDAKKRHGQVCAFCGTNLAKHVDDPYACGPCLRIQYSQNLATQPDKRAYQDKRHYAEWCTDYREIITRKIEDSDEPL